MTDAEAIDEIIKILWDDERPEEELCNHPRCGHNYICPACAQSIEVIEVVRKARGRYPKLSTSREFGDLNAPEKPWESQEVV